MADQQDPLAALQQLLKDEKKLNEQTPSSTVGKADTESKDEADANAPAVPTEEEIALLEQKSQVADQEKIEEELHKIKTELTDTPEYQERLAQENEKKISKAKELLERRSKEIIQLEHLRS